MTSKFLIAHLNLRAHFHDKDGTPPAIVDDNDEAIITSVQKVAPIDSGILVYDTKGVIDLSNQFTLDKTDKQAVSSVLIKSLSYGNACYVYTAMHGFILRFPGFSQYLTAITHELSTHKKEFHITRLLQNALTGHAASMDEINKTFVAQYTSDTIGTQQSAEELITYIIAQLTEEAGKVSVDLLRIANAHLVTPFAVAFQKYVTCLNKHQQTAGLAVIRMQDPIPNSESTTIPLDFIVRQRIYGTTYDNHSSDKGVTYEDDDQYYDAEGYTIHKSGVSYKWLNVPPKEPPAGFEKRKTDLLKSITLQHMPAKERLRRYCSQCAIKMYAGKTKLDQTRAHISGFVAVATIHEAVISPPPPYLYAYTVATNWLEKTVTHIRIASLTVKLNDNVSYRVASFCTKSGNTIFGHWESYVPVAADLSRFVCLDNYKPAATTVGIDEIKRIDTIFFVFLVREDYLQSHPHNAVIIYAH